MWHFQAKDLKVYAYGRITSSVNVLVCDVLSLGIVSKVYTQTQYA